MSTCRADTHYLCCSLFLLSTRSPFCQYLTGHRGDGVSPCPQTVPDLPSKVALSQPASPFPQWTIWVSPTSFHLWRRTRYIQPYLVQRDAPLRSAFVLSAIPLLSLSFQRVMMIGSATYPPPRPSHPSPHPSPTSKIFSTSWFAFCLSRLQWTRAKQ